MSAEAEAMVSQAQWHEGRMGYIRETIAALHEQLAMHEAKASELYLKAARLGATALLPEQRGEA